MSDGDQAQRSGGQFFTGTGPAITLWVLVVLALAYGIFKTVDTALALF